MIHLYKKYAFTLQYNSSDEDTEDTQLSAKVSDCADDDSGNRSASLKGTPLEPTVNRAETAKMNSVIADKQNDNRKLTCQRRQEIDRRTVAMHRINRVKTGTMKLMAPSQTILPAEHKQEQQAKPKMNEEQCHNRR